MSTKMRALIAILLLQLILIKTAYWMKYYRLNLEARTGFFVSGFVLVLNKYCILSFLQLPIRARPCSFIWSVLQFWNKVPLWRCEYIHSYVSLLLCATPKEGPYIIGVAISAIVNIWKISSVTSTVFVKKNKALANLKKIRKGKLMFTTCTALRIKMNFLCFSSFALENV